MAAMVAASLGMADNLKVLTYNIHGGKNLKNVYAPEPILEVLRKSDADFGGLNEVDVYCARSRFSDITSMIREKLHLSAQFAQAIPLSQNGQGKASGDYGLAAFGKQPLRVVEHFSLPVGSSEGRTALIVKASGPKPVYLVVTHLPWQEGQFWDTVLISCLKKIEKRLKEGNYYPAILTGDLNRLQDSAVIDYLRKNWTVCNDVNPQPTWPADKPHMQIDYIAFQPKSAFKVVNCQVLNEPMASDHRPLRVELAWPSANHRK